MRRAWSVPGGVCRVGVAGGQAVSQRSVADRAPCRTPCRAPSAMSGRGRGLSSPKVGEAVRLCGPCGGSRRFLHTARPRPGAGAPDRAASRRSLCSGDARLGRNGAHVAGQVSSCPSPTMRKPRLRHGRPAHGRPARRTVLPLRVGGTPRAYATMPVRSLDEIVSGAFGTVAGDSRYRRGRRSAPSRAMSDIQAARPGVRTCDCG